ADAEEMARLAVTRDPQNSDAHALLGTILMELGRFDDAAATFDVSIALNGRQLPAYQELIHVKKLREADRPLIAQVEWMLKECLLTEAERAGLHLALGKAYDDVNEYASAIRHFDEGNRLKHKTDGTYAAARHAAMIERIIDRFGAEFFERNATLASDWEAPLF